MRNEIWLENRFDSVFKKFFFDLEATNQIVVKFGRRGRRQLGAIKQLRSRLIGNHPSLFTSLKLRGSRKLRSGYRRGLDKHNPTTIIINGFFRDEEIPEFVVDAVIAHELSHYAHGFNSPLPQLH
ncbi:MAG: hypothetical protein NTW79_04330, partial [Candidatus Berkelbacteria bacterium]|nr:hypothetical protein [Candidatus Berkelbacteria bacterium]